MILHGDCRQQLATLEDCSVDSIVTDPPYELGFMGKKWDASGIAYDPTVWTECLRVLKPGGHLLAFGGTRTYHRMTVAIEDAGFEIREAQDCRAARTEIAARRPDLLLVDWMLPDMTGLEFTRQLKRDPNLKELPVIMLTARAEEADKVAGLEGGADDYVTKPFSTRELMARIQAVPDEDALGRYVTMRVGEERTAVIRPSSTIGNYRRIVRVA